MRYFIRQLGEKDCAFAAMKMLLATIKRNSSYLYIEQSKINESYSLKEIIDIAKEYGVFLNAYRSKDKNDIFKSKNKPFLILLNKDNKFHLVMVKNVYKNKIKIYDSRYGIYSIKKDELFSIWTGDFLKVIKEEKVKFEKKKYNAIPKYRIILAAIFQILSALSIFVSLYFINKSENFYFFMSLILFLSSFIFEIIYQTLSVSNMKYFDKKLFKGEYTINNKEFRKKYIDMTNLKILNSSIYLELVSSILLILALFIILGINSWINIFILLSITFLIYLENMFNRSFLDKKRYQLEELEEVMFMSTNLNNKEFEDRLELLNKETYKFAKYVNFKKNFSIIFILLLALLFAYLSKNFSISNIFFHFFTYLFFFDNVNKLISIEHKFTKFKYYKCLYFYYFNNY